MTGQSRFGQQQAVLQSAELVSLQRVCQDLLAIGILEREGKFFACLGLRRLVVTLCVSEAAHVDGLSRTVDAAVGINVEMMSNPVVVVLRITPSDAFLLVDIILATRQLDVQIVPLPVIGQLCYASGISRFLPEQSIVASVSLVEADLHTLLRLAAHRVCHHHALFSFWQGNGHKGEGRHREQGNNT